MKFNFENATPVNQEFRQADETWSYQDAEAGDSREGLLVSIRRDVGPNNNFVYTLQDKDDRLIDIWGCAVLDHHLSNLDPNKWGVKLVYDGKKVPEDGGRKYHAFTIYKVPADEAIDDVPEPEEIGQ